MKALIDSDSLVYAAGFASEQKVYVAYDEEGNVLGDSLDKGYLKQQYPDCAIDSYANAYGDALAKWNADEMVERILEGLGKHVAVGSYQLYLTGGGNFRKEVATIQPYKGNRVAPRPFHFETIRNHLVEQWGAIVVEGREADDEVAMEAWDDWIGSWGDPSICFRVIVSIDKDLDQVPGYHYSWATHNKEEKFWFQSEDEARRCFWTQALTGDNGDNIPGLPKIGPKKAEKILKECTTWEEMKDAVVKTYLDKGYDLDRLNEVAELLYLLRSEDDKWEPVK